MKLSIAAFSLAIASVQGASLRLNKEIADKHNKILGTEIILDGTVGEPTEEDLRFLGKAFVASYNNVHWEVGHAMTGIQAVDFKGLDGAASSSVFEIKTPIVEGSTNSLLATSLTEDCAGLCKKKASAELEVNFCGKIRVQDSKFLSSAKSCAIRFDIDTDERAPADAKVVGNIDSTIILKGVGAGDATQEEQAILAKAFVSAYNEVHWGDNFHMTDAEVPFTAATELYGHYSWLCRHCPDDDAMGGASASETNTMVLDIVSPVELYGHYSWLCRHCPDDDAMGASQFELESLNSTPFDKKAVEVAFCNKLQNSASEKLSSAKSCSIAVESVIAPNAKSNTW